MQHDQKAVSHFDAVLAAMMDVGRDRGEMAARLPALVLMAVRVASDRTHPGYWQSSVGWPGRRSHADVHHLIFTVLELMDDHGAVKRLAEMVLRMGEVTLEIWLDLVDRLDVEREPGAQRAFAVWFGERLDDLEAWSGGSFGMVVPPAVSRLMVSLVELRAGMRVLDPVCATGGFLAAAWQAVSRPGIELFGIDRNPDILATVQLRLYLRGILARREERTGSPVIMIDANDAGRRERRRAFLTEEECATIHRIVSGEAVDPGAIRVRAVSADVIQEADFDLRPERYIERKYAGDKRTLEERRRAVAALEREYEGMVRETNSLIERLARHD